MRGVQLIAKMSISKQEQPVIKGGNIHIHFKAEMDKETKFACWGLTTPIKREKIIGRERGVNVGSQRETIEGKR